MSRKIAYAYLGLLAAVGPAAGSDVGHFPPGQKPFHAPKAPKPAGVLADTCFGYFQTRWTPWGVACTAGPCANGTCVPPIGSVVITETGPAKAAPAPVHPTTPPMPLPPPTPKK